MDKKAAIIIPEIFNESPICDFIPQTAKILSSINPVYIYFTNFPKKRWQKNILKQNKNLFYCYPKEYLPFIRFAFIRQINNLISFFLLHIYCHYQYFTRPIYWFFYPQLINFIKLPLHPQKIIYDIVDNFSLPISQKKFLLTHSNIVTAISHSLIKINQKISPKTQIHLVPQGFNIQNSATINSNLDRIKKLSNKVGFIGAIGNRLDYKILLKLIPSTPFVNYIFIGPIVSDSNTIQKPIKKLTKKLFSFSNVHYINMVPKDQIFQFIKTFDIGIIPYDITQDFNKYCYPMKLFEYLYAGKPVIATPIEELKQFPSLVKIGSNSAQWQTHIIKTLNSFSPQLQIQAKKIAQDNSWQNKISQTTSLF